MKAIYRFILLSFTTILIIVFSACNSEPVQVNNYYITNSAADNGQADSTAVSTPSAESSKPSNAPSSSTISPTKIEYGTDSSIMLNTKYSVNGTKNYLALRNAPAYDASNEIGKLQNGDEVFIMSQTTYGDKGEYVYISAQSGAARGKEGYVNRNYLVVSASKPSVVTSDNGYSVGDLFEVTGTKNYLGVRSAPVYDESNVTFKVPNGGRVYLMSTENYGDKGEYWYVGVDGVGNNQNAVGYVNKNYLVKVDSGTSVQKPSSTAPKASPSNSSTYTVTGTTNYLAVRTDPVYNESNVIYKLNNGDTVEVTSTATYGDKGEYWYVTVPGAGVSGYANKKYLK